MFSEIWQYPSQPVPPESAVGAIRFVNALWWCLFYFYPVKFSISPAVKKCFFRQTFYISLALSARAFQCIKKNVMGRVTHNPWNASGIQHQPSAGIVKVRSLRAQQPNAKGKRAGTVWWHTGTRMSKRHWQEGWHPLTGWRDMGDAGLISAPLKKHILQDSQVWLIVLCGKAVDPRGYETEFKPTCHIADVILVKKYPMSPKASYGNSEEGPNIGYHFSPPHPVYL